MKCMNRVYGCAEIVRMVLANRLLYFRKTLSVKTNSRFLREFASDRSASAFLFCAVGQGADFIDAAFGVCLPADHPEAESVHWAKLKGEISSSVASESFHRFRKP